MEKLVIVMVVAGIAYFLTYRLLLRLIWKEHEIGHHNRAIWLANLAIRFYPRPAQALVSRSAINSNYFRDFESVVKDCTRAIRFKKSAALAYNNRGYAYHQLGFAEESINDFDMAIILQPDLLNAHVNRALLLYNFVQDYQAARAVCSIALRRFPLVFAFYRIIVACYLEVDDFDKAIRVCSEATRNTLDAAYVQCLRALILEKQHGLEEAQQAIDKALGRAPNDAIVLSNIAIIYTRAYKFEKALEIRNTQVLVQPNYHVVYAARGYLHIRLRQYDKAMDDFNHAIELNPYAAAAHNNRAGLLNVLERYDEALSDVNRCIELEPILKNGYGTRGEIYLATGDYHAALSDFEKAEELKMNDGFALIGQAISQYKLGNIDEAKSLWEWGIEQEPQIADIEYVIREFDPPQSFVDAVKEVMALT